MSDLMPVREQDDFDRTAMSEWFHQTLPALGAVQEVEQFAGGASNLTYLVHAAGGEVVVRTSPSGRKASSAHDMLREAAFMTAVRAQFPEVPEILATCDEDGPLGRPFFVMSKVEGVIVRRDLPEGYPGAEMAESYIAGLARLHTLDVERPELVAFNRGSGYVARQVAGWNRRYQQARTDDVPDGEAVMRWLEAAQPDDVGSCVIHNDWRFDNFIVDSHDPARIRAVLDWELATVGDPFMDLSSALAYWVQSDDPPELQAFRRQPTNAPGMPNRAQVLARYCEASGRTVPEWTFYEVFGLFRLAGIAQQIWYRYYHSQTTNPAFAGFGAAVTFLVTRCESLIGAQAA